MTPRIRRLIGAIPLIIGASFLLKALHGESLQYALLGAGMVLMGLFAMRHDAGDLSPEGLDPRRIGAPWLLVMVAGVGLVLAAAGVSLFG